VPIAVLIADRGDTRDAVGLYLAGRGWTTVPQAPDPTSVAELAARLTPGLIAIDFRGCEGPAQACLEALGAGDVPIVLFNAPDGAGASVPRAVRAGGPQDVPEAPGHPGPPHDI
jgi:hypothetical protein